MLRDPMVDPCTLHRNVNIEVLTGIVVKWTCVTNLPRLREVYFVHEMIRRTNR